MTSTEVERARCRRTADGAGARLAAGSGVEVAEVTTWLSAARMPSGSAVVGAGRVHGGAAAPASVVGVGMATSGAATTARSWAWPPDRDAGPDDHHEAHRQDGDDPHRRQRPPLQADRLLDQVRRRRRCTAAVAARRATGTTQAGAVHGAVGDQDEQRPVEDVDAVGHQAEHGQRAPRQRPRQEARSSGWPAARRR